MRMKIEYRLQCRVRHSDATGLYVASCPLLDLATQGRTEDEARRAIEGGITMFLKACLRRGVLEKFLTQRGFAVVDDAVPTSIPPTADGEFVNVSPDDSVWDVNIPVYMLPQSGFGFPNREKESCPS